jgi:hypothetical protein
LEEVLRVLGICKKFQEFLEFSVWNTTSFSHFWGNFRSDCNFWLLTIWEPLEDLKIVFFAQGNFGFPTLNKAD